MPPIYIEFVTLRFFILNIVYFPLYNLKPGLNMVHPMHVGLLHRIGSNSIYSVHNKNSDSKFLRYQIKVNKKISIKHNFTISPISSFMWRESDPFTF